MQRYTIRKFTTDRLETVRQRWEGIAGEDEFALELSGLFQWCSTHVEPSDGDSQALELYSIDADKCDAIVEIVNGRKGKLSKLLKLFPSPSYWDATDRYPEVVALYAHTFALVIREGLVKGAQDVKLYGRNELMLSILRSLHAHWRTEQTGTTASFSGRWLTITFNS